MKVEQGRGERDKKLQCYSNTNNQKFIEFSETVKIYTLAFCAFFFFLHLGWLVQKYKFEAFLKKHLEG